MTEADVKALPELTCDICDRPAVGVCASVLGPMSMAMCRDCLQGQAQPAWLIEFTLAQCGSWANVREDLRDWLHVYKDGAYKLATEVYSDEDAKRFKEEFDADVKAMEERERAAGVPELMEDLPREEKQ